MCRDEKRDDPKKKKKKERRHTLSKTFNPSLSTDDGRWMSDRLLDEQAKVAAAPFTNLARRVSLEGLEGSRDRTSTKGIRMDARLFLHLQVSDKWRAGRRRGKETTSHLFWSFFGQRNSSHT